MAGGVSPKKRLSDLRKTRRIVKFEGFDEDDDGNPEPYEIEVWVVKLYDEDMQACRQAADAAKARTMIDRGNRESEQWQAAYGATLEIGVDAAALAEYLSYYHVADKSMVLHAELTGDENSEWGKDGFINGLLDAWRGTEETGPGLQLAYAAKDDPDGVDPDIAALIPEAERVFAELQRFEEAFEQKLDVERQRFMRENEHEPVEDLRVRVVELVLDQQAEAVWMRAFERARVYYSTRRLDDWRKRYFDDMRELTSDTHPEFIRKLEAAYREMSVEGVEGKGSRGPQSSSPRSGSSGEEETSEASGPTAAND